MSEDGISCCIPAIPDGTKFRRPIKFIAVASAIVGISGVAAGGIVGFLMKRNIIAENTSLLAAALCCSAGGILAMFAPTMAERFIVRKHFAQSDGRAVSTNPDEIHVSLEHAPTYGRLKILAEDVGMLSICPQWHCIVVRGLSYLYVIHRDDVVALALHGNRKSVLVSYKMGQEQLDLAIVPRSIRSELQRQTMGSSRTIFDRIREALDAANGSEK